MAFGDFTVVRSTVKNVLNSSGVLASVAINTPAFEFNADGSYKGLLVEPGATNLLTYSQALDNGVYSPVNITLTANNDVAPDGTTTADLLVSNTVSVTEHRVRVSGIFSISTKYTASVFFKKHATVNGYIRELSNDYFSTINLVTGVVTDSGTIVGRATEYPNYWRLECTFTTPGVIANNLLDFGITGVGGNISSTIAIGVGTSLWGAQLETGSVATSYIPTVASTVARTADDITLTSASSLIGQLTGAVYCEVNMRQFSGGFRRLFTTRPQPLGANGGQAIVTNGLDLVVATYGISVTLSPTAYPAGISKYLLTYTAGDVRVYRNGALLGSSTTAYSFTDNQDNIFLACDNSGSGITQQLNDHIRAFATFPTTFTEAQAIAITTL
jgi:hypothetical protein